MKMLVISEYLWILQEALYEGALQVKEKCNKLENENMKLKTQAHQLERQNNKLKKLLFEIEESQA